MSLEPKTFFDVEPPMSRLAIALKPSRLLLTLCTLGLLAMGCVAQSAEGGDEADGTDAELISLDEAALEAETTAPSGARPNVCLCACDGDGAAYIVKNTTPLGSCIDVCQLFFAAHPGLCDGLGTGFPIAK